MCGIYGMVGLNVGADARRRFLVSAGEALASRGPDGSGVWSDDICSLGHTRLAILDLTDAAAQPMSSASNQTVITFNGEIYNYLELRDATSPPDAGWKSSGDTEVLLEALEREGPSALTSASGMFALGLWSPARRELLLARDRLGKKPLYYARSPDGGLRFASELGALLADGVLPRRTTPARLAEFLQHGYVSGPRTAFCGIHTVPPGHLLRVSVSDAGITVKLECFWQLPRATQPRTRREWLDAFDAALLDATRSRLRSDVPVGAFLSGGVDSSVVALLASETSPRRVRTFTVDFAEADHSEGRHAEEVARHLGTDHLTMTLSARDAISLPEVVAVYGDLHGDPSALPTIAVCRAARQHVKVVLSGDGGDELLGGYTRYARALRGVAEASRLPDAFLRCGRAIAGTMPFWLPGANRLGRMTSDLAAFYAADVRTFGGRNWPPILRPSGEPWSDPVAETLVKHRARAPLQQLMATDVETYLPDEILVKVDRASMSCGLEVRSPLLDHRLFELTMTAPSAWLSDGLQTKLPLRELYASRLPRPVFARAKMGFGVPLEAWFRDGAFDEPLEQLCSGRDPLVSVLDTSAVRRMVRMHRSGLYPQPGRTWNLLVLQAWFAHWRPDLVEDEARGPAASAASRA